MDVTVDAVVTHHRDGFRSGVARFNELLAASMGVRLLGLDELETEGPRCPLLSFKISELNPEEEARLNALLEAAPWAWELFLHDYRNLPLERRLVHGAQRVHCGNSEITSRVPVHQDVVDTLWTPGLIHDDRTFRPTEISIFSFGMAHKIRTDMFEQLKSILEASGRSYSLYVSAANHETASLRDAQTVFEEMHELFPDTLYFLGNLSDVAVSNYLQTTTFFAAFFGGGVRANNTSVASAMERGAAVITNLDEHSPAEFVHGENVLDINRLAELPTDPLVLGRLSVRAIETGRSRNWGALVAALRGR